jgi:hypothetical protein
MLRTPLFARAAHLATSGLWLVVSCSAWAQTVQYQEVEAVATSDVALYICAQAYPAGLPQLKIKLAENLRQLHAPQATLRAAKAYAGLYNSQLNAILTTSKKEREEFCRAAAE